MLLKDFLPCAVDFINQNKAQIQDYAKQLKAAGGYNDFDIKLACDCFYFQQYKIKKSTKNYDFDLLQDIANHCNIKKDDICDYHITSLYKQAIKQSKITL